MIAWHTAEKEPYYYVSSVSSTGTTIDTLSENTFEAAAQWVRDHKDNELAGLQPQFPAN